MTHICWHTQSMDVDEDWDQNLDLSLSDTSGWSLNKAFAHMIWAASRENMSSEVCGQHRRRPACASAQSDQRLCYSLFGKFHM